MISTGSSSRLPQGLRVLAVEDEALIALDLEDMLRSSGADEVIVARDFDEVERALATRPIDLAIINLDPSADSGADFRPARAVQACGIPFLFATGADGAAAVDFADAIFVSKPYTRETIIAAVLETLTRSRSA
jgi:DNA-binding response OmpR family regulator